MTKVAALGLPDEGVSIGEKEDALFGAALPKPMDYLEGGVGFASAGRHGEQDALLALSYGFNAAIDGDALVIARIFAAAVKEVILADDAFLLWGGDAFVALVALPELIWCGELIEG